jgi:ubiquinone biosynthesis protein UbiJ
MKSWVIVSVGVGLAAAISAKPLSRLRKPEKNDKLKICLGVALVVAAVVIAYVPRKTKTRMVGGAQCTVRATAPVAPQIGAGYQPYVVPEDLTVGGGIDLTVPDLTAPTLTAPDLTLTAPVPKAVAIFPDDAIGSAYEVAAAAPNTTAIAPEQELTEIVVGGALRLVGDF